MGGLFSMGRLKAKPPRALMLGLDNAGKTALLYHRLSDKYAEMKTTVQTIGFNYEKIVYDGSEIEVLDIGGMDKIRTLWRHYYDGVSMVIFVIDSSDMMRFDEAKNELDKLLRAERLKSWPFLILANKQDRDNALSASELECKLDLTYFICCGIENIRNIVLDHFQHSMNNLFIPNAVKEIICGYLGDERPIKRKIAILPVSAVNGEGVEEAKKWLFAESRFHKSY